MKEHKKFFFTILSTLFVINALTFALQPVKASEIFMWEAYVPSSGEEIVSPMLKAGALYRIAVEGIWWYNYEDNLAADAQYYTTDFSNSWNWGNYFPAPDDHSFLQIDGEDVDWGAFSNGDTGHKYAINMNGKNAAVTFRIVDWMDEDYANNECQLLVRIYAYVSVGGQVVDFTPLDIAKLWTVTVLLVTLFATISAIKYHKGFQRAIH
ncbi:MAG: hypothetical protein QXX08_04765 [Candidatus Bathyarchaeia archaeon]